MPATETIHLRGMAWDHRRCWGPLDASVAPYRALVPGVEVGWQRRSLYSFGEGRLDTLVDAADLVILDHPFVGDIAAHGYFHDFRSLLPAADLEVLAADSLGDCWRSYAFDGGQWALPIDAAAQVAACRPDLLGADALPATFDEVLALAEALRPRALHVAVPAIPTDLMCLFITFAASLGHDVEPADAELVPPAVGSEVIDRLRRLLAVAHPASRDWNPIRCYDHMAAADDVAYVPYAFGYVNYAAPASARPLRFADAPAQVAGRPARAILGGAGIAISARSAHPEAAARYALHLCRPEFQATDYVRHGGQPASRRAWTDAQADALTAGFFSGTLRTLENAYLRPTLPGFVALFHEAGLALADCLDGGRSAARFVAGLNQGYARLGDRGDTVALQGSGA